METKEIKLKAKQLEIISNILKEKQELSDAFQKAINPILKRENDFLVTLCEENGVEAVQGIEIKESSIFVPIKIKEIKEPEMVVKKSKK